MNINDMSELIGELKSFSFNDNESTVVLRSEVIGYFKNGSDEIGLYLRGWTASETLYYDNTPNLEKDIKVLKNHFQ